MKRNSLTTAVVAGIAGVAGFAGLANAVDLNPDGLGQVLIYPYYTVNKSQDTLISVVNTSDVGKAVKVRFLEGYDSREVLDFNLFLSPHDVWTAAVSQTADDGGGQIFTADTSCIDYIPAFPYPFSTRGFDGSLSYAPADGGPTDITRTREGYLEMILMGDIRPGSDLDDATKHDQDGTPDGGHPSCGAPVQDDAATVADLDPPTSGLFGSGSIVNVGEGTFFSYNADAIEGFAYQVNYTNPSDLTPTLQAAATDPVTATPALAGNARSYVFGEDGTLITADFVAGEDAVSAVYMADSIYNEYLIAEGIGAATDWVLTFPTKRFYVDSALYPAHVTAPFAEKFGATDDNQSRVNIGIETYDQEEGSLETVIPRCPSPPDDSCFAHAPFLPYEVNVLSFTATSPAGGSTVFGSQLYKTVAPFGDAGGWAAIDLATGDGGHVLGGGVNPANTDAVTFSGLPVTGFYAMNVINANAAPGKLANYSGVYRHRAHRTCTDTVTGLACS
jgi:hypothetical protein